MTANAQNGKRTTCKSSHNFKAMQTGEGTRSLPLKRKKMVNSMRQVFLNNFNSSFPDFISMPLKTIYNKSSNSIVIEQPFDSQNV